MASALLLPLVANNADAAATATVTAESKSTTVLYANTMGEKEFHN